MDLAPNVGLRSDPREGVGRGRNLDAVYPQLIDRDVEAADAPKLDHALTDGDWPRADEVAADGEGRRRGPVDASGQYHRVDFDLDAVFVDRPASSHADPYHDATRISVPSMNSRRCRRRHSMRSSGQRMRGTKQEGRPPRGQKVSAPPRQSVLTAADLHHTMNLTGSRSRPG